MKLFSEIDLGKYIRAQENKIFERIEKYSNDEIMANDLSILANNCYEEFKINPVQIGEEDLSRRSVVRSKDRAKSPYSSTNIDFDCITAKFYFPFSGDDVLFKCQASSFQLSAYPDVDIDRNYLVFTYTRKLSDISSPENARDKLLSELLRDLNSVKSGIEFANKDVDVFNSHIQVKAHHALNVRRKRVEQFYSISQIFEVPLEKSEYAVQNIPMQRKIIPIAKTYNNEPTYCISDQEYQFILDTIKHNLSTYERTPSSYKSMQEEDLRNTLLAALNGMYKGGASGEVFRNNGKTDICIEKENRAAFVAECKMWTGQAAIESALSQLDGYLTWRDCKTALIFFSRNKDFWNVLKVAKETVEKLPFCRQVKERDKNEFECLLASTSNRGQIIKTRLMLFNLYSD